MAKQYPNRSDLRNPAQKVAKMAATGQTYGKATEQMRAQEAVPVASAPTDTAPTPPPAPAPGALGEFGRPTERPDEPGTFGSMVGAGPGPEVLGIGPTVPQLGSKRDLVERVRAVADAYPSPVLLMFLSELERS
jgi:hypothetical protein